MSKRKACNSALIFYVIQLIFHFCWSLLFFGTASESNESDYNIDVMEIISQIEIYDQVWAKRHMLEEGEYSQEAIDMVKQFVARLQEIEDECAERFPFDIIEELEQDYL